MRDLWLTGAFGLAVALITVFGSGGGFGRRNLHRMREEVELLQILNPDSEEARQLQAHISRRMSLYTATAGERWYRRGSRLADVVGLSMLSFAALDLVSSILDGERPTPFTIWLVGGTAGFLLLLVAAVGGVKVYLFLRRTSGSKQPAA